MSQPASAKSDPQVPRRHVLFIEDAPNYGGDTKQGVSMMAGLDRSDFQLTLVTASEGPTFERARAIPGITHLTFEFGPQLNEPADMPALEKPLRRLIGLARIGSIAAQLVAYVKRHDVTVVGSGDRLRSCLTASLVSAMASVPQVFYPGCHLHAYSGIVRRMAARRAAVIIGNSGFTAESYGSLGVPTSRLAPVHNAIDPEQFTRYIGDRSFRKECEISPDALVFGWVGRWTTIKGTDDLLEAFAILHRKHPEVVLLTAGSGDLDEVRTRLVKLGIEKCVRIAPFQREVGKVFGAMDIFVMPSHDEPFGYVTIEAMASGLAVIGTASGGTPEIVVPDQTGRLFPPRDPAAMAEAMAWMIENRQTWQGWGAAGRLRVVQHFNERQRISKLAQALAPFARGLP